ncbi:hypothetical protein LguiA_012806 [Lonicera macranthoides]
MRVETELCLLVHVEAANEMSEKSRNVNGSMNEIASKALDETGAIHVPMIMAREFRGAHFLYGLPNATWEIIAQARPDLPRPTDINFNDELMEERKDWLVIVASHCDEWLRSYCASSSGYNALQFNYTIWGQLLDLINDLATVQDVVNDNFDDNEVRLKMIEDLYNDAEEIKPVISDIRKVQVAAPVSDDGEAPINEEMQQEQEADDVNPIEEALNEELQIEEPVFVEAPINAEQQQQEQESDDVNPVEEVLNEVLQIKEPLFVEAPINAKQQEQEADDVNPVEVALNEELEIQEPLFVEEPINAEHQQQEQQADDVNPIEVALNEELEIQEFVFVEEEPVFDLCYDCRVERDWMAGNKCVLMTSAMKDDSRCPSYRFKNRRLQQDITIVIAYNNGQPLFRPDVR